MRSIICLIFVVTLTTRVSRVINFEDTSNKGNSHFRIDNNDTTLAELLVNMVREGAITAYMPIAADFKEIISDAALKSLFKAVYDTIECEDIDGKIINISVRHEFKYSDVMQFRVLEDWVLYRKTGKTEIQIIGIAPLKKVWNSNHDKQIARIPMFWLKYDDIKDILNSYENNHPKRNFDLSVWEDYFMH